jgi:hypothetical protein
VSDSSGACKGDNCVSDKSGGCTTDKCSVDSSGACESDDCNSDYSEACTTDVCILDVSTTCDSDLCREDRTPELCTEEVDCVNDTCALDLASNTGKNREQFAKSGINEAIRRLYRLSAIVLFMGAAFGSAEAEIVIDATNAVSSPSPVYVTSGSVSVPAPVGPFLRDCDDDEVLEADTNGDGLCAGDPEALDYNDDGTKELPAGTIFAGDFQFTCFYIPSDVAIVATGPLNIWASQEVAIFGAMRLATGSTISSSAMIDLRTSPWLSEDGSANTFTTALSGDVDEAQTPYNKDGTVLPVEFSSLCALKKQHLLTINGSGNGSGSVSAAGISCNINGGAATGDCTELYNEGTAVVLAPDPASDSTFAGFTGDSDCSDGSVTMNSAMTCTANFVLVLTAPSDLVTSSLTGSAAAFGPFIRRVDVDYRVKNQGVGNAPASRLRFYLSKDMTFSSDDIYIGVVDISGLDAGTEGPLPYGSATFSLEEETVSTGIWHLLSIADADDVITESDETNNIRATTQPITIRKW